MASESKSQTFLLRLYPHIQSTSSQCKFTTRFLHETWEYMHRWYFRNHLQRYGGTPKSALMAYFLASANIFEPGRAAERLAWARMAVLAEAVTTHFRHIGYVCSLIVSPLRDLGFSDDRCKMFVQFIAGVHAIQQRILKSLSTLFHLTMFPAAFVKR
jgi:hypothetical protein